MFGTFSDGAEMLPPICVLCRCTMRCIKNEVLVKDKPTEEFPSTFWYGDQFSCPSCKSEIIVGFGKPLQQSIDHQDALAFDRS